MSGTELNDSATSLDSVFSAASRVMRRSRDFNSPAARLSAASLESALPGGPRPSLDSVHSVLSGAGVPEKSEDDALHEFFMMCCNAINLGRINGCGMVWYHGAKS